LASCLAITKSSKGNTSPTARSYLGPRSSLPNFSSNPPALLFSQTVGFYCKPPDIENLEDSRTEKLRGHAKLWPTLSIATE